MKRAVRIAHAYRVRRNPIRWYKLGRPIPAHRKVRRAL